MPTFFTHPVTCFVLGLVLAFILVGVSLTSCAPVNRSQEEIAAYKEELNQTSADAQLDPTSEAAAVKRFTTFLQGIGDANFIRENTRLVYAENAYLNDTLVTKRGVPAIEAYFLETNKAMKSYQVTINDVARSGPDHYIRWTMVFAASALAGGEPVHSTGISQVRFNREGQVILHQDFWDSGKNFFGHLPVAGSAIEFIRRRLH